ncbi:MAG: glycosyltransferase family 39 protein [Kineosporiaceae bacterium]
MAPPRARQASRSTARAPLPWPATITAAVLGVAALAAVVRLWRSSPFQAAASYDDGVYGQTLLAVADGQRLYHDVFQAQPPLFIALFSLPVRLGAGLGGARAAMLLVWLCLAVGTGLLARRLAGTAAGLLAVAAFVAVPLNRVNAVTLGADVPAAAAGTFALLAALAAIDAATPARRRGWALAAGVLVVAGTAVKVSALTLAPAVVVALLLARGRARWSALGWAGLGGVAAGLLAVAAFRPDGVMWDQVVSFHTDAAESGFPGEGTAFLFKPGFVWLWRIWLAAVAGSLVGCAVLVWDLQRLRGRRPAAADESSPDGQRSTALEARVRTAAWAGAALTVACAAVFTLRFEPLFMHQLLLYLPASCAAAAGGLVLVLRAALRPLRGGERLVLAPVAVLTCLVTLVAVAAEPVRPAPTSRAVQCLQALRLEGPVVTDDQPLITRAGLRATPWLADTSSVRILSGYLTRSEVEQAAESSVGAVVAKPGRFTLRLPGTLERLQERWPLTVDLPGHRVLLPAGTPVPRACR